MEVFGIIGMSFGSMGFVFGIIAMAQSAECKKELEKIKKALKESSVQARR